LRRQRRSKKETTQRRKRNLFMFLVYKKDSKQEPNKTKRQKKDMVSNIYTIIMVLKLKHELEIENLKLLEKRR
jgi:hypothetical protein